MAWQEGYIAVDWGTTNRRAYRIEHGQCRDNFADEMGVLAVPRDGFAAAASDIRKQLGDLPMLMGGMVGSDRGWRQAPYVECPAGVADLAKSVLWIDERTGIVPGVCQRGPSADVMRGEEIQLVGAVAAGTVPPDGLVCHPGTHAKWAKMDAGRIARFSTVMTGEVFALLRKHSILAADLEGDVSPGPEFDAGVAEGMTGEPPLAVLFRIRARRLLEGGSADTVSRASGILIGSEVAAALRSFPEKPVSVIGRPDLCQLYARALSIAGRDCSTVAGPVAFQSGMAALAALL
jgi:2-dehydro-3-deoxygalactonokinase